MLYLNPNPRALAFALLRTFVYPWDSTALGGVVLVLAALGLVQLLWRDRRSLAAVMALAGPVSRVSPAVPGHDVHPLRAAAGAGRGVSRRARRLDWRPRTAVPVVAALVSIAGVAVASPRARGLQRGAESRPCAPFDAMQARSARRRQPGALAMHQTFVRPLEAEDVGISPQLPSPPRLEWLELAGHWQVGQDAADVVSRRSAAQRSRADRSGEPAAIRRSSAGRWSPVPHSAACGRRRCGGTGCRRPDGSPTRAGR